MVTDRGTDLASVLAMLGRHKRGQRGTGEGSGSAAAAPVYACPTCGRAGLSEDALVEHHALFHVHEANHDARCPVCGKHAALIAVHLHDCHGAEARAHGPGFGRRPAVSLSAFALVVVRRPSDGRFLLVQEFANKVCVSAGAYALWGLCMRPRVWLCCGSRCRWRHR